MKKKAGDMTEAGAVKKSRRQIKAVIIVGMLLIAVDIFIPAGGEIGVERSDKHLYLVRPEEDKEAANLLLTATVEAENGIYEKKINLALAAYENGADEGTAAEEKVETEMPEDERIEYAMKSIESGINADSSKKRVELPERLESGERISWSVEKAPQSNTPAIIIIMLAVSAIIYKERFSSIRKRERENREEVLRQLPGFINRLVLLLNAGLVINNAFYKAVEESIASRESDSNYFYKNLKGIYESMRTANASMSKELRDFAVRSGVRELMRISNIIDDNISKGTELTHKLQREAELLWEERKKRCEEMGRMAETKLTLPLILFLMALIIITIAPALLEL